MGIFDDIYTSLTGGGGGGGGGSGGSTESLWNVADQIRTAVTSIKTKVETFSIPTPADIKNAFFTEIDSRVAAAKQALEQGFATMVTTFFDELQKFLKGLFAPENPDKLQPVQAQQIVQQIADAITAAESKLNSQSLVIANGQVELDVYLSPTDPRGIPNTTAGARAKITFNIVPKQ